MAGHVRPMEECDVPMLVNLHEQIYGGAAGVSRSALARHFEQVFLRHPWRDDSMPSYVWQTECGHISGCLGVVPRPMIYQGNQVRAAISHNFMVESAARKSMAALQLAKAFLSGRQDISIAQGNDLSRKLWEGAQGRVSPIYSLSWVQPLRPGQYLLKILQRRGLSPVLSAMVNPLCRLTDGVVPGLLNKPYPKLDDDLIVDELDARALCECFEAYGADRSLLPRYDVGAAKWLLEFLKKRTGSGELHKILLRNAGHDPIGWYLYYGDRGEIGEVVQVGARKALLAPVLRHLFDHALERGVIALSGQLEPELLPELSKFDTVFHHDRSSWMLVHSSDPSLVNAVQTGNAFLSRLEGEWWINKIHGA